MSTSPMKTRPLVGVSRPARQCNNVDLPDPEGPMMAVNSTEANSTDTPRSASTAASPSPNTLRSSTAPAATDRVAPGGSSGAGMPSSLDGDVGRASLRHAVACNIQGPADHPIVTVSLRWSDPQVNDNRSVQS